MPAPEGFHRRGKRRHQQRRPTPAGLALAEALAWRLPAQNAQYHPCRLRAAAGSGGGAVEGCPEASYPGANGS